MILLQPGRTMLQKNADKVISRCHARVDQLLTHAQMLFTTEFEETAHRTVLQIDIGLVVSVLTGDAV
ncbi:hypothetical protein D3C76_1023540 [compost metagenome]